MAWATAMQPEAFASFIRIPTGQVFAPVAHRSELSGMLAGLPAFWNLRRG